MSETRATNTKPRATVGGAGIRRGGSRLRWLPVLFTLVMVAAACTPPPGGGGPGGTDAPVAVASGSPTIGDAPLVVVFDSTGSSVGAGSDVQFAWDFGDGATGTGPNATHTYETPGVYFARLTITTTSGSSTSSAVQVTVNADANPKYYVHSGSADSATCGPVLEPCATIAHAQQRAIDDGIGSLRVASGFYAGPLYLQSNMHISGGWTSDFGGFDEFALSTILGTGDAAPVIIDGVDNAAIDGVRAAGAYRESGDAVGMLINDSNAIRVGDVDGPDTIVSGGTGPNATGILVRGSSVKIHAVNVASGASTGAGESTYGIRALDASTLEVRWSEVVAASANDGVDAPDEVPADAPNGCDGGAGGNAPTTYTPGEPGLAASGPNCTYRGGWGGRGAYGTDPPGTSGNGQGPHGGSGGDGGVDTNETGWIPAEGGQGGGAGRATAAGATGGSAANDLGDSAFELFMPVPGADGADGAPGSGGGGGGGGGARPGEVGGGGGAGGSGGPGGTGGLGATSGGGSFGIYVVEASAVDVQATQIAAGYGGDGGDGGPGGNAGDGGDGGKGGTMNPRAPRAGGGGGGGGGGGAGGSGGGAGGGGPSIALFNAGGTLLGLDAGTNTYEKALSRSWSGYTGEGGLGGDGGERAVGIDGGIEGTRGEDGERGAGGLLVGRERGHSFNIWNNGVTGDPSL